MIALKPVPGIARFFRSPSPHIGPTVLDPELFERLVQRERLRADRNGETFSLIVMASRNALHSQTMLPVLAEVLSSRLRATDDVGQIDDDRLGVLLPDTPGAGAWTVVDHIVHLLPKDVPSPICEVYTYPSFDNEDRGEAMGRRSDDNEVDDARVGEGAPVGQNEELRESRPMESLFMISLPSWKRAMDVMGALLGLIVMSPLLLLTAIAVKLTSRGPVFFKQFRRGQGGRKFVLYKFRSMVDNAEALQRELRHRNEQDGPAFKIKADPRITPLGKILRRTGLDEFPQLWNVLKGDMSLVGPRPLPCHESDASETWQQRRLDAKPGLTCIWQSRGHEEVSFADWMRMDMRYVEERSFSMDTTLIAKTVLMVLRCRASG